MITALREMKSEDKQRQSKPTDRQRSARQARNMFRAVRHLGSLSLRAITNLPLACAVGLHHKRITNSIAQGQLRPRTILILCYGNICRSPVAERLVRRLLRGMTIRSAGFHTTAGRPSPANIQSAATSLGLDMSDHRSQQVTPELIREADLVVLMDLQNFRLLRRFFPEAVSKTALLGMFLNERRWEIQDPYGTSVPETEAILSQIHCGCDKLVALLENSENRY
jgi:protein-tyrosine phosphatase